MIVDRYAHDWLGTLEGWSDQLQPGASLYCLIDGVFLPGLYREFGNLLGQQVVHLLFDGRPGLTEEVKDISPFLIAYRRDHLAFSDLLSRCSGWPMFSVIESTEPIQSLAERFRAWCLVDTGWQLFNFRFPDTRRLPSILSVLDEKQLGSLVGPSSRWGYIDRAGCWDIVELKHESLDISLGPQPITESQFAYLVEDSETDEMIGRLAYRGTGVAFAPSERYLIVHDALRYATQNSVSSDALLSWCEHIVQVGVMADQERMAGLLKEWREKAWYD